MIKNELLTIEEAYKAMFLYLENLYHLTNSDDLGGFLGSMVMLPDGKPIDPAVWEDWIKACSAIKEQQ